MEVVNMEEIEIGEYVRTNDGIIGKITDIDICEICEEETYIISLNYQGKILHQNNITKHSKNIIDLIEVGDYVNGKEVLQVYRNELRLNTENNVLCFIKEYEIETILTYEQYENNAFKVVE